MTTAASQQWKDAERAIRLDVWYMIYQDSRREWHFWNIGEYTNAEIDKFLQA